MNLGANALNSPARNVGRPLVYILGTEDGNEVKIGYTKRSWRARKSSHENSNGRIEPLRFLAAVRVVQPSDESAIHRHFAQHCSRAGSDEWFHAVPAIRAWIRSLQGQPYAAATEAEVDDLELVDASHWLPVSMQAQAEQSQLVLDTDPWADLIPDELTDGDFYTDPLITNAARSAMGGIDLDPASCTFANRHSVQARTFYGFRDNGLLQDWRGRVWLNPPFGQWEGWALKAEQEYAAGRVTQMCILAPSRATTARNFIPVVRIASRIWMPDRRWAFFGPKATSSPDEGHFVYYVGRGPHGFDDAFAALGGAVFSKSPKRESQDAA